MPPPTPVYTLAEYQTLSAAIATGALTVEYGDKKVTYRSLNDMIRIQTLMYNALYPNENINKGKTFASFSKGTDCRRRNRY